MMIKRLSIFFILFVLVGCAAYVPPVGVGDPRLIYEQSVRISQIDLRATASLGYIRLINGWTDERKAFYNAYYVYYQAAANSIAKGDVEGFNAFMDAAENQLKLLVLDPVL